MNGFKISPGTKERQRYFKGTELIAYGDEPWPFYEQ